MIWRAVKHSSVSDEVILLKVWSAKLQYKMDAGIYNMSSMLCKVNSPNGPELEINVRQWSLIEKEQKLGCGTIGL